MDTIWIALGAVTVFWLGFRLGRAHVIVQLAREIAQEAGLDPLTGDETVFDVEKHQGMYYAYSQHKEFLAQGASLLDLITALKAQWPGRVFRVSQQQNNFTVDENHQLIQAIFKVFSNHNTEEKQK